MFGFRKKEKQKERIGEFVLKMLDIHNKSIDVKIQKCNNRVDRLIEKIEYNSDILNENSFADLGNKARFAPTDNDMIDDQFTERRDKLRRRLGGFGING